MIYGILAGNKLHLSEIACSLKENITLKKTVDRLSKNLNAFGNENLIMRNYISLVKQHVKEDYAVIFLKTSAPNVSVPSTVVLMPMTITAIS